MKRNAAILFLVVVLIAGAGAFLLRYHEEPEFAAQTPPTQTASVQPEQTSGGALNTTASDTLSPASEGAQNPETPNPFAVRTWEPPRPGAQIAAPPPPPQAPPLPFRFIGRVSDPERGNAFMLTAGDRVLSVKAGDVLDGQYLVEEYRDGQLHFLYQPMNIRQTLFVGHDS